MFAKTLTTVIVTATVLCGCNPDETKVTVKASALKSAVEGNMVSQLIRLNYITADEAQKSVEGFKDPNGLFQVFERNNAILVTDTQENINRMLEIIKELDVPNSILEETFERQIKYAKATDIKTYLETIRGKVLIVADEPSNKLIIITAKTNMDFFDKVITALDVETTPRGIKGSAPIDAVALTQ